MRKAAYIIGTICAVCSLGGAILKLSGIPGGGILLVLFTSLFSVSAMPLFLYSLSKKETEKTIQFAIRLCGFSFAVLQVGLLFCAQRWPRPEQFIYTGLIAQVVFMIVFFVNVRKPGVKTKAFSPFAVLAILVLLPLVAGCVTGKAKSEEAEKMRAEFIKEWNAYSTLGYSIDDNKILSALDTTSSGKAARKFHDNYLAMIVYIETLKEDLVNIVNNGETPYEDTIRYLVLHPADYDVPTSYFVGTDPAKPNGKGIELYRHLKGYRENVLHPAINFIIPIQDGAEYEEQWVKDNFYHVTVMDALTRLTVIQKSILLSVQESYDKKLFRETE